MSKLAALDDLLELYYQLNYHQNPDIFQRLQDVQAWQKTRMQSTHLRQFAEKHNLLMVNSYHTSRYNINTGVLTYEMFEEIIRKISDMLKKS